MFQKFLVLMCLCGFSWKISNGLTPIRKCTEALPAPHYVQINNCEGNPCNLVAGTTANITLKFNTVKNVEAIHAQVVAYIDRQSFPIPIPSDYADVCKHLENDSQCPLKAGDETTYNLLLPLDGGLPDFYVDVEIALVDANEDCVSCFVADVKMNHRTD